MAQAILDQLLVHKLAAVVHVDCTKGKRQTEANAVECLHNKTAIAHHEWCSFGPTAGDIRQHQAADITAAVSLPTMRLGAHET